MKGASQDPSEHPHAPAGSPAGGQFIPTGGGSDGGGKSKPGHGYHASHHAGGHSSGSGGHGGGHSGGSSHSHDGTLQYDPKTNQGTGYNSPHGDARVRTVQEAFNRVGITDSAGHKLTVDGRLGPKTTSAVKELQARLGLPQDGKVTPALLAKIKAMKSAPPAKRSEATVDLSARAQLLGVEQRIYPAKFEVRASPDGTGGTKYSLTGYATVYDKPYPMVDKYGEYEERVRPGAAKKTLSERPDVVLRMDHAGVPFARTKNGSLQLAEDSTGLEYRAPELNGSRQDIRDCLTAVDDGIVDESSFQFKTTRQRWSDDYQKRDLDEFSLNRGDVSLVTFGANPSTSDHLQLAVRAQDLDVDVLDERSARDLYERLTRRFNPPAPRRSLAMLKALAAVQG